MTAVKIHSVGWPFFWITFYCENIDLLKQVLLKALQNSVILKTTITKFTLALPDLKDNGCTYILNFISFLFILANCLCKKGLAFAQIILVLKGTFFWVWSSVHTSEEGWAWKDLLSWSHWTDQQQPSAGVGYLVGAQFCLGTRLNLTTKKINKLTKINRINIISLPIYLLISKPRFMMHTGPLFRCPTIKYTWAEAINKTFFLSLEIWFLCV